jgi:hypothetical protein
MKEVQKPTKTNKPKAKLTKNEEEQVLKNLSRFPYRGLVSQIARIRGRKPQTIRESIVEKRNPELLLIIFNLAEQRKAQIVNNLVA